MLAKNASVDLTRSLAKNGELVMSPTMDLLLHYLPLSLQMWDKCNISLANRRTLNFLADPIVIANKVINEGNYSRSTDGEFEMVHSCTHSTICLAVNHQIASLRSTKNM
ncbi:hypothetical protein LXL04_000225 [Taraxacum kok-saghyz]